MPSLSHSWSVNLSSQLASWDSDSFYLLTSPPFHLYHAYSHVFKCKWDLFSLYNSALPCYHVEVQRWLFSSFPTSLSLNFPNPPWTLHSSHAKLVFQNTLVTKEANSERLSLRNLFCALYHTSSIPSASSFSLTQCHCVKQVVSLITIYWRPVFACAWWSFHRLISRWRPSAVRIVSSWLLTRHMDSRLTASWSTKRIFSFNILISLVGKLRPRA